MRPISGFERPVVQWLLVVLSVMLIAVAGGAAWMARRERAAANVAQATEEAGRLERQHLEGQLARERSAREALALELARQRETGSEPVRVMPTLTLAPVDTRGATPPPPAVTMQHATQVIELRLILPPGAERYTRFDVVLREWSSGSVAWSRGGLLATTVDRQKMVAAFVTGDLFKAGPYELLLSGVTREGHKEGAASYEVAFK